MSGGRRAREVALVVGVTALQAAGVTTGPTRSDPYAVVATLGAALALAQGAALLARRRAPGLVGAGITAALLVQVLVVQPVPPYAAWAATWTAVRSGRPLAARAGVPLAVLGVLAVTAARWPRSSGWVPLALVLTAVVVLGAALVEARAARTQALADRAASLERERDTAVARAAAEERLRLARDLHDLVGHGLTGIAVQSSTARLAVQDGDLDRASSALRAVEASARDALAEVRQLLGMLRSDEGVPGSRTLQDLPALVEAACAAGTDVRLDLDAEPVPPALGLTAYRVVQEALTNASRHAPGAPVHVVVRRDGSVLQVRVQDDGGAPTGRPVGSGHGLVGMHERVQAAGGALEAGPDGAGGWRVEARLPVRPDR